MLVPQPRRAVEEIRRVLKPGGRTALMVWSAPERNPFLALPFPILERFGLMPPPQGDRQSGRFALGAQGALERVLNDGGFRTVAVESAELEWRFASVGEALEYYKMMAAQLPPEATERLSQATGQRIFDELQRALKQFARPDGVALPGEALICSGTK
jgi:hypothetical protein